MMSASRGRHRAANRPRPSPQSCRGLRRRRPRTGRPAGRARRQLVPIWKARLISVALLIMREPPDVDQVATALHVSTGLLLRRLRQLKAEGELTLPESAALARLSRGGPTTAGALARLEQISPQSMGATLAGLEARGLVERQQDPADGRRGRLALGAAGQRMVSDRRSARTRQLAAALAAGFTGTELDQLMAAAPLLERLADSI